MITKLSKQISLVAIVYLFIQTSLITDASPPNHSRLTGGGGVINVVNERSSTSSDVVLYVVHAGTLDQIPVMIKVHLALKSSNNNTKARLSINNQQWYDQFEASIQKDGEFENTYRLKLITDSERFVRHISEGMLADIPATLSPGESVYSLWKLVGNNGSILAPGLYRITFRSVPGFENFFGIRGGFGGDFELLVKDRIAGDSNRYTEDFIQRYYLYGSWLYKFNKKSSKQEFEKGWRLVSKYIRDGAGDEPDLWNITPRWQASLISGWLDRPHDEISNLSKLLSNNATQFANNKECKMRYYHFGKEKGHLPRNIKDDLGRKVNRLYESFYGKTMNGRPTQALRPWPRRFEDSPDPTKLIPSILRD